MCPHIIAPKRLTTLSRAHSLGPVERGQNGSSRERKSSEQQSSNVERSAAELLLRVSIMTEANYRKHHALTEGLARPRGRAAMKLTYFEVMAKGLG